MARLRFLHLCFERLPPATSLSLCVCVLVNARGSIVPCVRSYFILTLVLWIAHFFVSISIFKSLFLSLSVFHSNCVMVKLIQFQVQWTSRFSMCILLYSAFIHVLCLLAISIFISISFIHSPPELILANSPIAPTSPSYISDSLASFSTLLYCY